MYISKITFKNYGPLENIKFTARNTVDGKQCPIVIFGQNGSGKTLFLSNILHALIENKRMKYEKIMEVSDNNFYRIGSLNYINTKALHSYNRIEFSDESSFTEVMTKNYKSFKDEYSASDYPGVNIEDQQLKDVGFFNSVIPPNQNVFDNEVFLFFPVERYYIPTWINQANESLTYVANEQRVIGKSSSNMIKYNVLASIEEWLLDVIIDKELYERTGVFSDNDGNVRLVYSGRNNNIQRAINSFLSILYKHKGFDEARIAITERHSLYRQIKIIGRKDNIEEEIMPTITSMSSGEAMVLGMMASILREADRVGLGNFNIKDITGIVLIDEIDAHMHSDFIQDALPELIGFFSGIQFIVSSHSPFFLLGMKDYFGDDCIFVELPYGEIVDNLINFKEIRNSFDIVNKTYSVFFDDYKKIEEELQQIKLPLIITEGKTDWKHLKHALDFFHDNALFSSVNVKFLEYDSDMGAEKLDSLLSKLAMIPHIAPIIGVFDNDCKVGKKYIEPKEIGNKVFACSLTDTQGYGEEISIELLYQRDDLTKLCSDKRRLYLSDEFSEKSHQLKMNPSIVSQNKTISDAYKRGIIKIVDAAVYNDKEEELSVSKDEFATRVYEGQSPYDNINVDGFRHIFQTIETLIAGDRQEV